jgi:hypothetical protein
MRLSWFTLSLALGASAVVIEERAVCTKKFVANYDDLKAPTLLDSIKPVGVYNGLDYDGFSPGVSRCLPQFITGGGSALTYVKTKGTPETLGRGGSKHPEEHHCCVPHQ